MTIVANLLILLLVVVGGLLLQIFLSGRESRWPGLILPGIALVYALLTVLNVAVFDEMTGGAVFSRIAAAFLLGNVPTAVLLGIYFTCREKRKRRAQLDKMNIQDLD